MIEHCPLFDTPSDPEFGPPVFTSIPDVCMACARVALAEARLLHGRQHVEEIEDDDGGWDVAAALTDRAEWAENLLIRPGEDSTARIVHTDGERLINSSTGWTAWRALSYKEATFRCKRPQSKETG